MNKYVKIIGLLVIGYALGAAHWYGYCSVQAYYMGYETGYSIGMSDAALAAEQGNLIIFDGKPVYVE